MSDTLKSLRAERDELLEEVARLRAQQATHVCAQPGMTVYPQSMPAAGCAGGAQVLTLNTTAMPATYNLPLGAFNGGAAPQPQSIWFSVGGECA